MARDTFSDVTGASYSLDVEVDYRYRYDSGDRGTWHRPPDPAEAEVEVVRVLWNGHALDLPSALRQDIARDLEDAMLNDLERMDDDD